MSRSYEHSIHTAIGNAPRIYTDANTGDAIVTQAPVEDHPLLYLPDEAPIRFNTEEYTPAPHQIIVPTLEEMIKLRMQSATEFGLQYGEIEENDILHEEEHAEAARKLGAKAILYGMSFYKIHVTGEEYRASIGIQTFIEPHHVETTKLGLAAICARPTKPSADDRAYLTSVGLSVDEVGSRVAAHNTAYPDTPIPIPLSYNP